MEFAKQGAIALSSSDPKTAVDAYTKALLEHPTSPDYFVQRSKAFTQLKPPRHDLALQDAEVAVLCGQWRGKRDKIQAGQQRRVVSYYNSGRYADAKFILDGMKKWRDEKSKPQKMEHDVWNAKITKKLEGGDQAVTTTEYPTLSLPEETSNEKAVKKLLQLQLKKDGSFDFDGEETAVDKEKAVMDSQSANPSTIGTNGASTIPIQSSAPPQKIRHEWYQNNQNVIVTLYAKGVPKNKADVHIEEDSVSVSFPHPSDPASTFEFNLDPLFAFIDPSSSKCQVMSTKVELTLAKAVPGQKWSNIEGTAPLKKSDNQSQSTDPANAAVLSTLQQPPAQSAPSYPTSSKHGVKNWDKLAADLTAKKPKSKKKTPSEDKKGSDSEDAGDDDYESDMGGDAVDGFFKKLYKGADPDTRRAMMKSFQESNGTALSTNWADVGSKKVEEVKSKND